MSCSRQPDRRARAPSQLGNKLVLAIQCVADPRGVEGPRVIVASFLFFERLVGPDGRQLSESALADLDAKALVAEGGSAERRCDKTEPHFATVGRLMSAIEEEEVLVYGSSSWWYCPAPTLEYMRVSQRSQLESGKKTSRTKKSKKEVYTQAAGGRVFIRSLSQVQVR